MKACEHIIGVLHNYEDTKTITYEKLTETVRCANDLSKKYSLQQHTNLQDYFNRRKSTALEHFKYCPVGGARLDWAVMKNRAEEEDKNNE